MLVLAIFIMLVGMGIPIMGLLAALVFDMGAVAWALHRKRERYTH